MKTFIRFITEAKKPKPEPEHEYCESCNKKHHPDDMRDVVHEHGTSKRCLNCVRDSDDLRHCARCERLHYSAHDSEHCPECEKKDNRHEVRYYRHSDGGDKQHEYFKTPAQAHAFAKKNSYNYGNSEVWHKGEHQKSYWQGK